MLDIKKPYVLFLGQATDLKDVKTATGVAIWSKGDAIAEAKLHACTVTTGLPCVSSPREAKSLRAQTLLVGCVSPAGKIDSAWLVMLEDYIMQGFDIACGMHDRLTNYPRLVRAARFMGTQLIDFRYQDIDYPLGTGRKRKGYRLLTVGHDANCGKKYTALSLHSYIARESLGLTSTFCATGQTGALIADPDTRFIVNDTTRADFLSGAAEWLSPDCDDSNHWYIVEGQGSIWHPSFAAGSLSLLLGSQPDIIILCVDPSRKTMRGTDYAPKAVVEEIDANLMFARRTNPSAVIGGISVNLSSVSKDLHASTLRSYAIHGYPVIDSNNESTFKDVVSHMKRLSSLD